jgi:hypothetical protein
METPDERTNPQKATDEIMEVLKKYDLAALVILMDQTDAAFVRRIDPTWSCAWIEEQGPGKPYLVRIRSRLQEDYGGDKERQHAEISATTGMFLTFQDWCEETKQNMVQIMEMLAKHFPKIEHVTRWTGSKSGGQWERRQDG